MFQSTNCLNSAMNNQMNRHLRLHGDNILECERTLNLISEAINVTPRLIKSPVYSPIYAYTGNGLNITVELLPGHGRWGVEITEEMMKSGGILREGADSYITEVSNGNETVLLAIEYCSALPAGNNAWQRNGRAYSSVLAGVPYLYYAEIGGVELDENRNIKAPRFPNPLVSFSYIAASSRMTKFCIPIYEPHPSINEALYARYKNILGHKESIDIIRGIILSTGYSEALSALQEKSLALVVQLSSERRTVDTFRGEEWGKYMNSDNKGEWLTKNSELTWKKKTASKVLTSPTFKKLFAKMIEFECLSIGAKDIPICYIPQHRIAEFERILKSIYPKLNIKISTKNGLCLVWVNGFKPKGDDSRPDRGLNPLARMVVGNSVPVLTIVYGPGKKYTWHLLYNNPAALVESNGLWQSVYNLSDYLLVDSATAEKVLFKKLNCRVEEIPETVQFEYHAPNLEYSEHDTDSVIHLLFSNKEKHQIYECMCNPPGGDWSGVSFFVDKDNEYRWTSLPRVSQIGGKRPDHVVQVKKDGKNIILSIESKLYGQDLEAYIGTNLKTYIEDLFSKSPTAQRLNNKDWRAYIGKPIHINGLTIFSVGAFIYKGVDDMRNHMEKGLLDAVFAVEFGEVSTLHLLATPNVKKLIVEIIEKYSNGIDGLKVEIH